MAQLTNNQSIQSTQVSTTSERTTQQTITAQFSNWNSELSDVRKRYWDEKSGQWYWKIEDVQDADTPNINQLDIPIQPNERVEIRVSAISEVGWPDTLLESDWSNVLTVDFPDDINDVINENDFILQEATQDQTLVQMDSTLNTKGIYQHIDDQFYLNNILFKHMDKNIATSFKGDMSQTLNLFEYLTSLTNRIKALEEQISKVKGELKIYLYKNDVLIKEVLNNTTTNIKIECEDYLTPITGKTRTYVNDMYMVDDYSIVLSNIAQSGALGLLSSRSYTGGTVYLTDIYDQTLIVDYNDDLYTQQNNQFIWFCDKDNQTNIYSGLTTNSLSQSPAILNTQNYNFGAYYLSTQFTGSQTYSPYTNINNLNWKLAGTNLLATVHPYIPDISNIIETGQEKVKNINPQTNFTVGTKIYFKPDGSKDNSEPFAVSASTPKSKVRKIKMYLETDGLTYQFTIAFTLSNFRLYFVGGSGGGTVVTGGGATA